jgi:hypothetical protein
LVLSFEQELNNNTKHITGESIRIGMKIWSQIYIIPG